VEAHLFGRVGLHMKGLAKWFDVFGRFAMFMRLRQHGGNHCSRIAASDLSSYVYEEDSGAQLH
jgi:hypothetical protein